MNIDVDATALSITPSNQLTITSNSITTAMIQASALTPSKMNMSTIIGTRLIQSVTNGPVNVNVDGSAIGFLGTSPNTP